jgi:hypothetical protein
MKGNVSVSRILLLLSLLVLGTSPLGMLGTGEAAGEKEKPIADNITPTSITWPADHSRVSLNGPNLTPYLLSGWSDIIVVSNHQGDHEDDSPLYDTDTLYVDYAMANTGTVATYGQTFWNTVYLDGVALVRNGPITSVDANHARYFEDLAVRLTAGIHTLTVVVDSSDQIRELDETDNQYSRTITIEPRGDEDVQFLSLTTDIGVLLQTGDDVTFIANCKGAGPIYYKFFYRAGYGTSGYDGNPWVIMQEFSTSNTCTYSFPEAGHYVVVAWAWNDPTHIPDDVPLMGLSIKVKSR